jgi:hypothetical protein
MENKQQMKKADKKGRRKSHLTSTQPVEHEMQLSAFRLHASIVTGAGLPSIIVIALVCLVCY